MAIKTCIQFRIIANYSSFVIIGQRKKADVLLWTRKLSSFYSFMFNAIANVSYDMLLSNCTSICSLTNCNNTHFRLIDNGGMITIKRISKIARRILYCPDIIVYFIFYSNTCVAFAKTTVIVIRMNNYHQCGSCEIIKPTYPPWSMSIISI